MPLALTIPAFAGYLALAVAIYLGEAGVPLLLPVELALVAAGVAAARGATDLGLVVAVGVGADLLGSLTLFAVVRLAGRMPRAPRRIRALIAWASDKSRTVKADSTPRVALARCFPFLRLPATIAAALAGLSTARYVMAAIPGGAVWVTLFAGGAYLVTSGAFGFLR